LYILAGWIIGHDIGQINYVHKTKDHNTAK